MAQVVEQPRGTVLVSGSHMELASDMGPGKDILQFIKGFIFKIITFNLQQLQ